MSYKALTGLLYAHPNTSNPDGTIYEIDPVAGTFNQVDLGPGTFNYFSTFAPARAGDGKSLYGMTGTYPNYKVVEIAGPYPFGSSSSADSTPPVITPTVEGTIGNDNWYTSDVTVSWAVADDESEVTSVTGGDTTVITEDTAGVTLTCEATSAGGTDSASVTVKRDATAPVIAITTPQDGAEYLIGEATEAVWEAADALSGLASASAGTIDTSTSEAKTFTVLAIDVAGNEAELTCNYYVLSISDMIDRLIAKVKSLNLQKGTENSLIAKLNAAKASLERGQENTAINQLNAFINEVQAQSGKKIVVSDADDLVSRAIRIIGAIQ